MDDLNGVPRGTTPHFFKERDMERRLVLSRKADEAVVFYVAGEKVEITCKHRDVLVIQADDRVRVLRKELEDKERAA